MESTVLIATHRKMQAVLELGVGGTGGYGPGNSLPNVTSMLHVEQLHLHANNLADFGVHSSGIIRSRFSFLAATHALKSGIKLQDGFINQIQDCTCAHNLVAGIHLYQNANAVEITHNEISGNLGLGVYVEGGAQVCLFLYFSTPCAMELPTRVKTVPIVYLM